MNKLKILIEKLEFMTNKKVLLKETSITGDIIGKTKSGKSIYDTAYQIGTNKIHPGHKDFSKEDHMDAIALHKNKYNKHNAKRKEILQRLKLEPNSKSLQMAKRHHNYEMRNHAQQAYSHAEANGDMSLYPPPNKSFK